ncbi:EF-hand domain-containing protein [Pseudoscourfieldia marina]
MSTPAGNHALGEVRKVLHGVRIADCPPELREKLAQYDTNGNGTIDPDELPDPMSAEMNYLKVSSFPKKVQPLLNEIDDEKNGKIEMDELTEILTVYVDLKKANKEGSIAIKTLPKEIQPTLKVFDVDGDGTVAPMELARGAELYKESKKTTKRLTIFSGILLVILCALVGVIVGLVAVVVENSKETKTDGSGITTVKGSSTIAATAAVVKTRTLYDAFKMPSSQLDGITSLMLTNKGRTYKHTITGFEKMPNKVIFFSARGDTVEATPNAITVKDSSGIPRFQKMSSEESRRRRELLANDGGSSNNNEDSMTQTQTQSSAGAECWESSDKTSCSGNAKCLWMPDSYCTLNFDKFVETCKGLTTGEACKANANCFWTPGSYPQATTKTLEESCENKGYTEDDCLKVGGGGCCHFEDQQCWAGGNEDGWEAKCDFQKLIDRLIDPRRLLEEEGYCSVDDSDYEKIEKAFATCEGLKTGEACKTNPDCEFAEYSYCMVEQFECSMEEVPDGQGGCKPLTVCNPNEYESVAPTKTSDRECKPLTVCNPNEYESVAPTKTSDRECKPLTVCDPNEESESVAPTMTSDRECVKKSGSEMSFFSSLSSFELLELLEASCEKKGYTKDECLKLGGGGCCHFEDQQCYAGGNEAGWEPAKCDFHKLIAENEEEDEDKDEEKDEDEDKDKDDDDKDEEKDEEEDEDKDEEKDEEEDEDEDKYKDEDEDKYKDEEKDEEEDEDKDDDDKDEEDEEEEKEEEKKNEETDSKEEKGKEEEKEDGA